MELQGTMMMDTGWPWIDWINDVWPMSANATPDTIAGVVLVTAIAVWWGHWNERV